MNRWTRREVAFAWAALSGLGLTRSDTLHAAAPAANRAKVDPMALVDEELRPILQDFLKQSTPTDWSVKGLPAMRELPARYTLPPLAQPAFIERLIPGPSGAPDVRVVVVGVVADASPRPVVLHMHGGGFVFGTTEQGIPTLQQLASNHSCVVVSVDYRLAPETRFPGSLEDNYAALRWVYSNAKKLNIDPNRIALLGESAGGGHAAMLALAARDRGEVPLAAQVLIYPMLDDRTGSTRPVPSHLGTFVWNSEANRFGWSSLLGVPAGSNSAPRGAVPARAQDLRGLPPTFIGVGSLDLFVEEDVTYAQRLIQAGVQTELLVAPGAFHAFDLLAPEATISKRFISAWNEALQRGLTAEQRAVKAK